MTIATMARCNRRAFTLVEVVISLALAVLVYGGIMKGYVIITDQAEWSCYSLAAQSLAMQGVEQVRSAKWDPQSWPPTDELGTTNYRVVEQLDVPISGNPVYATNYVSVSTVDVNPPLRMLRTDCVWCLPSRGAATRGPFTNTVVTLRCSDQ